MVPPMHSQEERLDLKKSVTITSTHALLNLTINFVFMYKILKVVNLNLHSPPCLPYINGFKVVPTKTSHNIYIFIKGDYLL